MSEEYLSVEHVELVHHVGSCVSDLKTALEGAEKLKAGLFFTSMIHNEEIYAQPLIIPVEIANKLAGAIIETPLMPSEEFSNYLQTSLFLMRLNHMRPAPIEMHFTFLEMYERMLHTGMYDKPEEVAKLVELTDGDLVVMQMVLDEEKMEVISGLRIVKKPLLAYEAGKGLTFPTTRTVH